MNTSLSTVDTLFNGQHLNVNSQGCSFSRSSPSFNDSEPPSYFEAIGINHVNLNQVESSNLSCLSSCQNGRIPKISLETAPQSSSKQDSRRPENFSIESANNKRGLNRQPIIIFQQNRGRAGENTSENGRINHPSETYFIWSVLTTFYCVIIGLPALIFSIKVYHHNKEEEYEKAFSRSKVAWCLNLIGLFFGIFYIGIVALILFFR